MKADKSGSSIFAQNVTSLNVYNTKFLDNYASNGGSIYIKNSNKPNKIEYSTFMNNTAQQGGAIYGEDIHLAIDNTEFISNSAFKCNSE